LRGDEIFDFFALLAVVDSLLGVLAADVLDELGFVLLEAFLDEHE
jgi:hypothetical protein